MKTSEKTRKLLRNSNHCIILWTRFVSLFRFRTLSPITERPTIICNPGQIKIVTQVFDLSVSMQPLLIPPWQAVEPQAAGMVIVYQEARSISTSLQNSSATDSSGWIQCQLDNTTVAVLVLQIKLSHPEVVD